MIQRREIDPQGAEYLVQAIVDRAIQDYMHATESSGLRTDAAKFFLSPWFEQLTGFSGKDVLKKLQADYDLKHQKKGKLKQ